MNYNAKTPPIALKDIWHPGEKKYIKKDGVLTEFGKQFFSKYHPPKVVTAQDSLKEK